MWMHLDSKGVKFLLKLRGRHKRMLPMAFTYYYTEIIAVY